MSSLPNFSVECFFCSNKPIIQQVDSSFFFNSTSHNHITMLTEAGNDAFLPTEYSYTKKKEFELGVIHPWSTGLFTIFYQILGIIDNRRYCCIEVGGLYTEQRDIENSSCCLSKVVHRSNFKYIYIIMRKKG